MSMDHKTGLVLVSETVTDEQDTRGSHPYVCLQFGWRTGFALIVTPEIVGSNTKVGGTSRDKVKSCYTKKWQPRWLGLLLGKSCPMEATG